MLGAEDCCDHPLVNGQFVDTYLVFPQITPIDADIISKGWDFICVICVICGEIGWADWWSE